jgi:hypothetical protein
MKERKEKKRKERKERNHFASALILARFYNELGFFKLNIF